MTDGCYSEGDSQGLPGFIHPRVLGIPTISFNKNTDLKTHCRMGGEEEVGMEAGEVEEVRMEAGEVEGVGREVKGERLVGEGVMLMVVTWMRFWLLPSRVSCVLLCPSLLMLHMYYILLLLVDLS